MRPKGKLFPEGKSLGKLYHNKFLDRRPLHLQQGGPLGNREPSAQGALGSQEAPWGPRARQKPKITKNRDFSAGKHRKMLKLLKKSGSVYHILAGDPCAKNIHFFRILGGPKYYPPNILGPTYYPLIFWVQNITP